MLNGSKVRALREAEGITLKELANAAGVTEVLMSFIERNLRDANSTVLVRIAKKLGVNANEILKDEEI